MSDDIELIEIRLPTFGKTFALSRETSARIWDAVKCGEARSAEEYVNRRLEEHLTTLNAQSEDIQNTPAADQDPKAGPK
jgi:hypothetical protein